MDQIWMAVVFITLLAIIVMLGMLLQGRRFQRRRTTINDLADQLECIDNQLMHLSVNVAELKDRKRRKKSKKVNYE